MGAVAEQKEIVLAIRVEPSLLEYIDRAGEKLTADTTVEFGPQWTRANVCRFLLKKGAVDLLAKEPRKTAPRKGKKAK